MCKRAGPSVPRILFFVLNRNSGGLVVVAPHPDDEVLGAGGLISHYVERGAPVDVILMTNGDGFVQDAERYYLALEVDATEYINLGYRRMREALDALAILGVGAEHVHFLGFPDGGLDRLLMDHWDAKPFQSLTSGVAESPYIETRGYGRPYLGRELWSLVRDLLLQQKPEVIVAPSAYDEHPDHWATGAFARLAGAELGIPVRHLSYLVHWPAWPFPLAFRPRQRQKAPEPLVRMHPHRWQELQLEPEAVVRKKRALLAYQSQVELIKPFMLAFARGSEMLFEESVDTMAGEEIPGGSTKRPRTSVTNPTRNILAQWLKKDTPIRRVGWAIVGGRQTAHIELTHAIKSDESFHVSVHMPKTGSMRHWRIDRDGIVRGDAAEKVGVQVKDQALLVSWPVSEYQSDHVILLGIQISSGGVFKGRTPLQLYRLPETLQSE